MEAITAARKLEYADWLPLGHISAGQGKPKAVLVSHDGLWGGEREELMCSIVQVQWYKFSHHCWFQGAVLRPAEHGVGKREHNQNQKNSFLATATGPCPSHRPGSGGMVGVPEGNQEMESK